MSADFEEKILRMRIALLSRLQRGIGAILYHRRKSNESRNGIKGEGGGGGEERREDKERKMRGGGNSNHAGVDCTLNYDSWYRQFTFAHPYTHCVAIANLQHQQKKKRKRREKGGEGEKFGGGRKQTFQSKGKTYLQIEIDLT